MNLVESFSRNAFKEIRCDRPPFLTEPKRSARVDFRAEVAKENVRRRMKR